MTIPRVVVVDDQAGRRLDQRRDLCALFGLRDVTGDDASPTVVAAPAAEAVFTSSQTVAGGAVENRVDIAVDVIRRGWTARQTRWALVLLDLSFRSGFLEADGQPSGNVGDEIFGLEILRALRTAIPALPVVMLSSRDRGEVIRACREAGAVDFIERVVTDGLQSTIVLRQKLHEFGLIEDLGRSDAIVGRSLPLLQALAAARRASTGDGNILLLGESGTGKELLARYVHDHSPRRKGPYIVFHGFGTAATLQEDELFGHVRGAFTDSRNDRAGLFEQADGGTLFIDEVGDLSDHVQNKLLRPLETRRISRQGTHREIELALQVVLATNKELADYASAGLFKFDLLNRIRAYTIALPPLNERREDIPAIVEHMVRRLCQQHGARWPRAFQPEALSMLVEHDWTDGNVRELRNVLERIIKDRKDAEIIVAADVYFEPCRTRQNGASPSPASAPPFADSYVAVEGSWPTLVTSFQDVAVQYLEAALESTRRRATGGNQGEVNLAGAVGCLLAKQVTTTQAADFIKRHFCSNGTAAISSDRYPLAAKAVEQALRMRRRKGAARSET